MATLLIIGSYAVYVSQNLKSAKGECFEIIYSYSLRELFSFFRCLLEVIQT